MTVHQHPPNRNTAAAPSTRVVGAPARWPALDGLRGIAVLAVLLYHGGASWAPGGFLGVDIFFVLSGFLITTLLLREHTNTGAVDLAHFWVRRAQRLLPALALVLLFIAAYVRFVAAPEQLARIRGDAIAAVAYVANWRFIASHHSYFDQFNAPSPLRHVWSLAIEEQFYLVWPPLVVVLLRHMDLRRLRNVVLGGAAASALLMALLVRGGQDVSRAYYGTDTRAQALLIGVALAAFVADRTRRNAPARPTTLARAGIVGAVVLLGMLFAVHDSARWMYRGGFAVAAVAAAGVVAAAVSPRSNGVTRLFDARPLRALGRISYGVYLWHWPLFLWLSPARVHQRGTRLLFVQIAVTIAVATLSWVLVEAPVLRYRFTLPKRALVLAPALLLSLAIVAVASVPRRGGAVSTDVALQKAQRLALAAGPSTSAPATPGAPGAPADNVPLRPAKRVLLVGDSVAKLMGVGFQNAAPKVGLAFWNQGQLGCGLLPRGRLKRGGVWADVDPSCANYLGEWQHVVTQFNPDVTLVLFDVWTVLDAQVNGKHVVFGTPNSDRLLTGLLDRGVRTLRARGGRVVFLTAPYNARGAAVGPPGVTWDEDNNAKVDHLNRLLRDYVAHHRDIGLIDLNAFTAPNHAFTNELAGVRLRYDGVHFTPSAGAMVFGWVAPQLPPVPAARP
ncbi:MAG: acyltransferase 3 [Actinomycetia bacterium]|nr:acyltransferase 3 [Actinomycetes bacterium]